MKKILSCCQGFIKSIIAGFVFLVFKLFSIVNKKPQISQEYINLNTNSDDDKKPPKPPQPKGGDKPSQGGSLGVGDK